jgi:hypothetical protein
MKQASLQKTFAIWLAAAALVFAPGCATVEYSSPDDLANVTIKGANGRVKEHVIIDTTGYYFLWTLPIFSGDVRWNEGKQSINGGITFFREMVNLENLQTAITKFAESRNCDLVDVSYNDTDASYAGVSYSGIIGSLFGQSHMVVCATLVPRK